MVESHSTQRLTAVFLAGVIGLAIAGYFVGIGAGVPREEINEAATEPLEELVSPYGSDDQQRLATAVDKHGGLIDAIPAADYSEMRQSESDTAIRPNPNLQTIHAGMEFERCISCHNPHSAAVGPNEQDKLRSLAIRASRRAYNGAPPVIPHAIDRTNDAACMACHSEGAVIGQRVANRMSHGPLTNCMQCHASPPPQPLAHLEKDPGNSFVGLAAPTAAPRAFPDAPPEIPHSTWMRERCLSCHGGAAGWPGLEVTHRWRTNCVQCHPTSMNLEQGVANASPHRPSESNASIGLVAR